MSGFVEGIDRSQSSLFPAHLEDYVAEDNPVRAIDAFVEGLDLGKLGFGRVEPLEKGRPCYHPATLLKIYIFGYLNRIPSSRRLERECQRNVEMIWLTGQLAPDFKTIADFRKDNGKAIREVCREFVALCRKLDLLSAASVAIDGSKFKAVNARDKNFTEAKMKRRLERVDESIARYLSQLETADRHGDAVPEAKVERLKGKIERLKEEIAPSRSPSLIGLRSGEASLCRAYRNVILVGRPFMADDPAIARTWVQWSTTKRSRVRTPQWLLGRSSKSTSDQLIE